ncbi:unnamed protein product [Prunus armeniaca]|uniref:Uncharacterized protein n=1 Tax=Prunus armeniaca TaxID=36596 RepID=A0A6J5W453_PRUAR|nr:unnamed protein product [Prunus armeniaca]
MNQTRAQPKMTKFSKNGHMLLLAASTRYSSVKGERIVRSVLTARLRDFQIIAWSRSHPSSPNKVVAATNSTVKSLVVVGELLFSAHQDHKIQVLKIDINVITKPHDLMKNTSNASPPSPP